MRTDVLTVASVAIAMATETRAGNTDPDVMASVLELLPDDTDVYVFVSLLRTFQRQAEVHGLDALQRSALGFARRACGLDP